MDRRREQDPTRRQAQVLQEEETAAAVLKQTAAGEAASAPVPPPPQPQAAPLALTFASAGLANALSATTTNGFDIVKVRQQLELDRARRGFIAVAVGMVRNEGALSLWNGVTASCLREATYSTIRMGGYESCKELYAPLVAPSAFANKLLSGVTSGALGAAISTPTDLVKVRFQAARPAGGRPPYRNTFVAFAEIFAEGRKRAVLDGRQSPVLAGFRSLFRGTLPNVIRAAILTSTQIGSYDEVKGFFKRTFAMEEGIALHFSSSMVAGALGVEKGSCNVWVEACRMVRGTCKLILVPLHPPYPHSYP